MKMTLIHEKEANSCFCQKSLRTPQSLQVLSFLLLQWVPTDRKNIFYLLLSQVSAANIIITDILWKYIPHLSERRTLICKRQEGDLHYCPLVMGRFLFCLFGSYLHTFPIRASQTSSRIVLAMVHEDKKLQPSLLNSFFGYRKQLIWEQHE